MYVLEFKNIELIVSIEHIVYLINIEHKVQDTRVNQVIVVLLNRVDEFTGKYSKPNTMLSLSGTIQCIHLKGLYLPVTPPTGCTIIYFS